MKKLGILIMLFIVVSLSACDFGSIQTETFESVKDVFRISYFVIIDEEESLTINISIHYDGELDEVAVLPTRISGTNPFISYIELLNEDDLLYSQKHNEPENVDNFMTIGKSSPHSFSEIINLVEIKKGITNINFNLQFNYNDQHYSFEESILIK